MSNLEAENQPADEEGEVEYKHHDDEEKQDEFKDRFYEVNGKKIVKRKSHISEQFFE